jgi:hypothetical protein
MQGGIYALFRKEGRMPGKGMSLERGLFKIELSGLIGL